MRCGWWWLKFFKWRKFLALNVFDDADNDDDDLENGSNLYKSDYNYMLGRLIGDETVVEWLDGSSSLTMHRLYIIVLFTQWHIFKISWRGHSMFGHKCFNKERGGQLMFSIYPIYAWPWLIFLVKWAMTEHPPPRINNINTPLRSRVNPLPCIGYGCHILPDVSSSSPPLGRPSPSPSSSPPSHSLLRHTIITIINRKSIVGGPSAEMISFQRCHVE